jgi:predicted RNA-binding protein YlxR (DUF448 family)
LKGNRLCLACRNEKNPKELLRITVDSTDSKIYLNQDLNAINTDTIANSGNTDFIKRVNGRSAYLCKSLTCLDNAFKGNRLKNALLGRKFKDKNKVKNTKISPLNWPLEAQIIKVLQRICTDSSKTCQNTPMEECS